MTARTKINPSRIPFNNYRERWATYCIPGISRRFAIFRARWWRSACTARAWDIIASGPSANGFFLPTDALILCLRLYEWRDSATLRIFPQRFHQINGFDLEVWVNLNTSERIFIRELSIFFFNVSSRCGQNTSENIIFKYIVVFIIF